LLPTIVNTASKIITWTQINGTNYVSSDYYYEISSSENLFYAFIFAIPSCVFWTFIYPLISFHLLRKKKNLLSTENMRKQYGFLYNSYKIKYYYWEFVEIYKKFLLIFILSYAQVEVESKALIVLLLIAFFGYCLSTANPYISTDINRLAFMGDVVSTSTIFIGLLSFSLEADYIRIITVFVVISGNIIFLSMFMLKMLIIYKKKIISILGSLPMMNSKVKRFFDKMQSMTMTRGLTSEKSISNVKGVESEILQNAKVLNSGNMRLIQIR